MLYRRKILLSLLQALGGQAHKLDFQKHLFLFTRKQVEPAFDFVPYKFGCYSFSAEADRRALVKQNILSSNEKWESIVNSDHIASLKEADKRALTRHVSHYGKLRSKELIRYVYQDYPYFAINSNIASDVLNRDELLKVEEAKTDYTEITLFTIGYEGKSFENYLNQLIENNITVLCDVRKNPISRKYGFSKRTLQNAVEQLGIEYKHIPGLGISSSKRQSLNTQEDYELLFSEYEEEILADCDTELNLILSLLKNGNRVALTCFELRPRQCHRGRVASRLMEDKRWDYTLLHI